MNISELSIRRPVLAVVISLIIILFGAIGYTFLGVRDYPAIDPPNISVSTSYAGANADIIESQITEPLEKAINSVPGIKNITSTSSQGSSRINVEFELGYNLEEAANDVRDKVSQAQRNLPEDLDAPPVVSKADASSDPILSMAVRSDTRNQLQITEFANNVLVDKLQTIPGVSGIQIWGEKKYAMRIWLNPTLMNARNITAADVAAAVRRENVELPSGKIAGDATELTVRTFGRVNTEEEFENVIVRNDVNGIVRLSDIADIVLGPENEESSFKERGVPTIGLAIIPQPGSNYISIAEEFDKRYKEIQEDLPDDITTSILLDQTKYIKKSLLEVEETLLIAFVLVVIIIYLFFRSATMAFRPLIDIPISLIGAFFVMYVMDFSVNVLTMLGIVLATGLVVDDGIVVTENIYKKMEQGMNKWAAAKAGSKEIYFAVISTSITLAVVFLPIMFLQGFVGRLFREFGMVVASAVLISALVSLTLTPVLNIKLTRKSGVSHGRFYKWSEPFFVGMENGYRKILNAFMKVRWVSFIIIAVCIGLIVWLSGTLKSELAPMEDKSQFRLQIRAPEGTSFDAMEKSVDRIAQFVKDSVPEADVIIALTAPGFSGGTVNNGMVRVVLKDPGERTRTQQEIVEYVSKYTKRFTEVRVFPSQDQTIQVNRRGGQPIQYVIQNNDFEKIKEKLPAFLDEVSKSTILTAADADLKFNKPEVRIQVDRLKATNLGVSINDISQALQLVLSNSRLGYFIREGKQYQIIGQLDRGHRDNPDDLKSIFVRNNLGQLISIDNLVTITEETTPPSLYHFNRYKSATVSANLAEGYAISDGIEEMERIKAKVLDDKFSTALAGTSREYAESQGNTNFALGMALVLIFLVLAAQFDSFIDPLIIMVTVPLAIGGAYLCLWIFDQTVNIFSQIGMIMLIGLVTKNGILIVEFANQKLETDNQLKKSQAAVESSVARLRPILMTSLAMAFGALPLALSFGAASTSRIPLGIVIVGGIVFSLILTLFVVPAMYSYMSRGHKNVPLHLMDDETLTPIEH